jgi:general secretion pathway protein G
MSNRIERGSDVLVSKESKTFLAKFRDTRKNESGFTLIELLIVIVILGVLSGIVVFSVSGITDRGKTSACRATVKTVQVAGEAYYANNTSYAANMGALVTGGFLQGPAPAASDITYAVTAGPPASLSVTAGTTGVCAP